MQENERQLADNIAYLIEIGRTSRPALAKAIGVTQQSLGQLINGSSKGLKPINLVKAARSVGISVDDLVMRDLRADGLQSHANPGSINNAVAEQAAGYTVSPEDSFAQDLELERMHDCIQVLMEHMTQLPRPLNFARACLLLYGISKQSGPKAVQSYVRRLLETIY